ncbi:unnamed protein product [[Candida] boidinii]|nr:unnamed protein product [[Candida] boidinii]
MGNNVGGMNNNNNNNNTNAGNTPNNTSNKKSQLKSKNSDTNTIISKGSPSIGGHTPQPVGSGNVDSPRKRSGLSPASVRSARSPMDTKSDIGNREDDLK